MKKTNISILSRLKQWGNRDLSGDNKYPSKTTINFMTAEKKKISIATKLGVLLAVLVIAVLCKFCVINLLEETYQAKENYQEIERNIQLLQEDSLQFANIREEYKRIGNGCLTSEEKNIPNRLAMLALIDETIVPDAQIESIDINENLVNIAITETTLEKIALMIERIKGQEAVLFVTVHTATNEKDSSVVDGTLSITFKLGGVSNAAV